MSHLPLIYYQVLKNHLVYIIQQGFKIYNVLYIFRLFNFRNCVNKIQEMLNIRKKSMLHRCIDVVTFRVQVTVQKASIKANTWCKIHPSVLIIKKIVICVCSPVVSLFLAICCKRQYKKRRTCNGTESVRSWEPRVGKSPCMHFHKKSFNIKYYIYFTLDEWAGKSWTGWVEQNKSENN